MPMFNKVSLLNMAPSVKAVKRMICLLSQVVHPRYLPPLCWRCASKVPRGSCAVRAVNAHGEGLRSRGLVGTSCSKE
ncbi:hypothetical protein CCICO_10745 [Corynebacterium ciconiae DSM 44920]|nr:hypothetical protein CCICO_10745 [Corynebacterium ciconiae DSM 44920]